MKLKVIYMFIFVGFLFTPVMKSSSLKTLTQKEGLYRCGASFTIGMLGGLLGWYYFPREKGKDKAEIKNLDKKYDEKIQKMIFVLLDGKIYLGKQGNPNKLY